MSLRTLDLFSGIGGFALPAERLGVETVQFCEIEPFCRKVLAAHWPGVPIHHDIRTLDAATLPPVDLVTAGYPCQGNSVAGKRGGHGDERSGLFAEILRLVDRMAPRPRWLLLENVAGLVSVRGGRDFRAVVGELQRRGYVGCVRLLDARYAGLAQRRRRLLFVCGLGAAGRRAVQLILEGGVRHPAPRREAGEGIAPTLAGCANATGGARPPGSAVDTAASFVVGAVSSKWSKGTGGPAGNEAYNLIAFDWQSGGDVWHNITHDGTPTLQASQVPAIAFAENQRAEVRLSDVALSLNTGGGKPVPGFPAVAISGCPTPKFGHDLNGSLRASCEGYVSEASSVRRLTPTECERLQGFPDGWTCLCGKNSGRSVAPAGEEPCSCPDGPRYRALGNAIAVPVAEWGLKKIIQAEEDCRGLGLQEAG